MKYKRRSMGEEKVQKIAAGEEETTGWKESPLKQTDRHHKSPGGDLCIRDRYNKKHHKVQKLYFIIFYWENVPFDIFWELYYKFS